jgi:3D (Asp-Asp-Asp) domain-containing protein
MITIAYASRGKAAAAPKKGEKKKKASRSSKPQPPQIGSAAADWSRWPIGTTFRILSTGQTYKIDDYGWALAGRNTIDLYMSSPADMNNWGVRNEPIQVLHWGDPSQSIEVLRQRQSFKHCRRMMLELHGQDAEAAALK